MLMGDIAAHYARIGATASVRLFTETVRNPGSRVRRIYFLRHYNPNVTRQTVEIDPRIRHVTEAMRWCHDNCVGGWCVARDRIDQFVFAVDTDAARFSRFFL